jgi:hypothetical protein
METLKDSQNALASDSNKGSVAKSTLPGIPSQRRLSLFKHGFILGFSTSSLAARLIVSRSDRVRNPLKCIYSHQPVRCLLPLKCLESRHCGFESSGAGSSQNSHQQSDRSRFQMERVYGFKRLQDTSTLSRFPAPLSIVHNTPASARSLWPRARICTLRSVSACFPPSSDLISL